jgi:hypothetical protein
MGLHEAPAPHMASAACWSAMAALGEQTSAQLFVPLGAVSAQLGVALAPAGTSVGQFAAPVPTHFGEQNEPGTPLTETACSPSLQPAAAQGSA